MSALRPATNDCTTARCFAAAWLLLISLPAHATDYSGLAVMLMTPVLGLAAVAFWLLSTSARPRKGVLVGALVVALPLGFLAAIGVADSLSLIGSGDAAQSFVYLAVAAAALAGLVRLVYRYMRAEDAARVGAGTRLPDGPPRPAGPVGDWVDEGKVWLEIVVGEGASHADLAERIGEALQQVGFCDGPAELRSLDTLDPLAPPGPARVRIEFHLLEGVERRRLAALLRGAGAPADALLTFTDSMRLCGVRLDEP